MQVDLNCDMGEGMTTDSAIFPFITSSNIACGAHAGDDDTMRRSVELALKFDVAIGAHPSYPDRDDFGRTDILESAPGVGDRRLGFSTLSDLLQEQLHRLQSICAEFGTRMTHVKPHGALYNRAAKDPTVATLVCQAIAAFDSSLLLYGLSGSRMQDVAEQHGLRYIHEVFADRTYQPDGSLTPRTQPHALIDTEAEALAQVLKMIKEGKVAVCPPGSGEVVIKAETICLHGDGSHAVQFTQLINQTLQKNGVYIAAP